MSSAHHRTAMVEAAIANNPAFSLSRVDLDRSGPSYTSGTLALLHQAFPGAELFFLMGGDSLAELHTWHDPAGVVRYAHLAVMDRSGWEVDLERLERVVPGIRDRLLRLDVPRLDISSSDLRRRVREGLPIRYLVPSAVDDYIRGHRLLTGEVE
jgi:nicotinate-nucleotide adenylyltransferase